MSSEPNLRARLPCVSFGDIGAVTALAGELVVRTTVWFRILVVVLLVALVVSTAYLSRQNRNLEARLEQEASFMLGISELLRRSEQEAITSMFSSGP